ncbi:adenosylhomocysteinase, partial [Candidatus Hakubella thermalkaliphila]
VTGNKWAINKEHIATMKDGAILANNGHFDVEIDVVRLKEMALSQRRIRQHVVEYTLPSGNRIYLLAEGRLVGQTAAEAHPAEIMDMSFAIQALAAEYLLKEPGSLENKVYLIPQEVDHSIARLKLKSMGIEMDELTDEQKEYLSSWTVGT